MVRTARPLTIGCAIRDPWAGGLCRRVVERAGVEVAHTTPETLTMPSQCQRFSALIYDLAPWDRHVRDRIDCLREFRPGIPILFYLPARPDALSLLPQCGQLTNVRFRMQLQADDQIRGVRTDVMWLMREVPAEQMMRIIAIEFAGAPVLLPLFCRIVLRRLTVGLRSSVTDVARELRLSSRSIQRHFDVDALGKPKRLIDRLTLWYIWSYAERFGVSRSSAGRCAGMSGNDLYRLRRRVCELLQTEGGSTWSRLFNEVGLH